MKKFETQICTTREQSERLIELGLKKETADMSWAEEVSQIYGVFAFTPDEWDDDVQPRWSLHRLIDLFPCLVEKKHCSVLLSVYKYGISCIYTNLLKNTKEAICFDAYDDLYENFIDAFEWAVDEGLVNKEYLTNI